MNTKHPAATVDRPVTLEQIPVIPDGSPDAGLPVLADGLRARVRLRGRHFASSKIVITFDEPHPRWDDAFTTKYFAMHEPGRLRWGHDGEVITLALLEPDAPVAESRRSQKAVNYLAAAGCPSIHASFGLGMDTGAAADLLRWAEQGFAGDAAIPAPDVAPWASGSAHAALMAAFTALGLPPDGPDQRRLDEAAEAVQAAVVGQLFWSLSHEFPGRLSTATQAQLQMLVLRSPDGSGGVGVIPMGYLKHPDFLFAEMLESGFLLDAWDVYQLDKEGQPLD